MNGRTVAMDSLTATDDADHVAQVEPPPSWSDVSAHGQLEGNSVLQSGTGRWWQQLHPAAGRRKNDIGPINIARRSATSGANSGESGPYRDTKATTPQSRS